jgi:Arc/MetJ-type ribon-helix-helix transcriptional regulator
VSTESRSKMISFRLSEAEYDRFRELCHARGIRSVSELVRAAVNVQLQEPGRVFQRDLESRVADLENRLDILSAEFSMRDRTNTGKAVSAPSE